MQKTQFKAIIFSLLASIISAKIAKIKTCYLEVWCNFLNNGFFYYD